MLLLGLFDLVQEAFEAVTAPVQGAVQDSATQILDAFNISGTQPGNILTQAVDPLGLAGVNQVGAVSPTVVSVAGAIPQNMTGFGGGNGKEATRTIVQTINLQTGRIVRFKILPGSPHLMNSEVSAAKRVFKISSKLHARMPRRTVKESKTKQLTDAAIAAATTAVTCPTTCKPPC